MDQDKHNPASGDDKQQNARNSSNENASHQHSHECRPKKRATPSVLKFKRRMYDGGNEAELVNTMERYYQAMTMAQTMPQAMPLTPVVQSPLNLSSEDPHANKPVTQTQPLSSDSTLGDDASVGNGMSCDIDKPGPGQKPDKSHLERLEALKPLVEAAEAESRASIGRHLKIVGGAAKASHAKTPNNVTHLPQGRGEATKEPLAAGAAANENQAKAKPNSRLTRAAQALILGPLEISVSLLGALTAGFALLTFFYFKNMQLHAHSWTVMHECKRTFIRGLKNTAMGPGRAIGHLLGKNPK